MTKTKKGKVVSNDDKENSQTTTIKPKGIERDQRTSKQTKNEERSTDFLMNDKKEGTAKFEDKGNTQRSKTEIICQNRHKDDERSIEYQLTNEKTECRSNLLPNKALSQSIPKSRPIISKPINDWINFNFLTKRIIEQTDNKTQNDFRKLIELIVFRETGREKDR